MSLLACVFNNELATAFHINVSMTLPLCYFGSVFKSFSLAEQSPTLKFFTLGRGYSLNDGNL